jgi:hypothetical protein
METWDQALDHAIVVSGLLTENARCLISYSMMAPSEKPKSDAESRTLLPKKHLKTETNSRHHAVTTIAHGLTVFRSPLWVPKEIGRKALNSWLTESHH